MEDRALLNAAPFDPSFGGTGAVTTDFHGGADAISAVALQPDGKIVVVGSASSTFALARYDSDGSLDETFGTGGKVRTNFTPPGSPHYISSAGDVLVLPGGKILALGSVFDITVLARYNADGTLDTTFGDPWNIYPVPGTTTHGRGVGLNRIHVEPDGNIVAAGWRSFGQESVVAHYTADGNLIDVIVTPLPSNGRFIAQDMVVHDSKIIVAGWAEVDTATPELPTETHFALARYNLDGSLDSTFDQDGLVTKAFPGTRGGLLSSVAIQPDGRIVVAGAIRSFGFVDDEVVARYNADGSLDTSFGNGGLVTTDFGGQSNAAASLVLQPDGKVITVGFVGPASGDLTAVRYHSDGSLDASFGTDGKTTFSYRDSATSEHVADAKLQNDGRLIVAGASFAPETGTGMDFAVARFLGQGDGGAVFDSDSDGIPDTVEDGAANGDGNRDGVPDKEQDNIASLPNAADGRYLTLAASVGKLRQVTAQDVAGPSSVALPVGRLSFTVEGLTPGSAVDVSIYLPPDVPIKELLKYGPTANDPADHWYEFGFNSAAGTGAEIIDGDLDLFTDRIILHLVDGGAGDNDLAADGRIVDPPAPARPGVQGIFVEDFSKDILIDDDGDKFADRTVGDPNVRGFDSLGDGFQFVHEFNQDGTFTVHEGLDHFVLPAHSFEIPVGSLYEDAHALVLRGWNRSAGDPAQVTIDEITFPGLATDLLVTLARVRFVGTGVATFVGRDDRYTVNLAYDTVPGAWENVSVDSNHAGDDGRAIGPIRQIILATTRTLYVDSLTTLVVLNRPPVAGTDEATTLPGQPVVIDLLANDADPDHDFLNISVAPAAHGVWQSLGRGIIGYTPDAGFHGYETFSYTISDGTYQATGQVRVLVDTPPTARTDEYVLEHGYRGAFTVAAPGVLVNDEDADRDLLTAELIQQPMQGHLELNPDGSFTYTPTTPRGLAPTHDEFTYGVRDSFGATTQTTVRIRVPNQAPAFAGTLREAIAAPHGAPAPLQADYPFVDGDGDIVAPIRVEDPAHGTVSFVIVAGQVRASYETNPGSVLGPDRFSFRLFDGYEYSDIMSVEILVPNNPPVAISDRFYVYPPDRDDPGDDSDDGDDRFLGSLKGPSLSDDRSFSERPWTTFFGQAAPIPGIDDPGYPGIFPRIVDDFDLDGDRLSYTIQSPQFGFLPDTNSTTGEIEYRPPFQRQLPVRDVVTGTIIIDASDRDADGDQTDPLTQTNQGYDWFTYSVSDGYSISEATAMIYFGKNDELDPHDVSLPLESAYELSSNSLIVTVDAGAFWNLSPHYNVRNGPYVVEGPHHGTTVLSANGSFRYDADPGFVGIDTFTFLFEARHGTVYPSQVSIIRRNQAPAARGDHFLAAGEQDLIILAKDGLLANDRDPEDPQAVANTLRVVSISQPSHGRIVSSGDDGRFVYRPNPGYRGTDSFVYIISDPFGSSDTATVTIDVQDPSLAGEIKNLATPTGQRVTLASSPGSALVNPDITETLPAPPPDGIEFPLGLLNFSITGLDPDGAATVTLTLPEGVHVSEYWKYGRERADNPNTPLNEGAYDHWWPFTYDPITRTGAQFIADADDDPDTDQIILYFVDGQRGDDDVTANGMIVDPGAPAFRLAPPAVKRVVVNDGRRQRSKINRITVTFSDVVTLDPGAFELIRYNGRRTWSAPLHVSTAILDGKTVATIAFRGPAARHGSLLNGDYRLVIHGDRIQALGRALDGDGDGVPGGDAHAEFFRRFGDTDGDGDVDRLDLSRFWNAFGSRAGQRDFRWFLDKNGDGTINGRDGGRPFGGFLGSI